MNFYALSSCRSSSSQWLFSAWVGRRRQALTARATEGLGLNISTRLSYLCHCDGDERHG
ncbi:MAG: hypothetical protein SNG27_05380 [Rikenellaceae bacterium]